MEYKWGMRAGTSLPAILYVTMHLFTVSGLKAMAWCGEVKGKRGQGSDGHVRVASRNSLTICLTRILTIASSPGQIRRYL